MSLRPLNPLDLRRRIERLCGLPIRPTSARAWLDAPHGDVGDSSGPLAKAGNHPADLDPGWAFAKLRGACSPLKIVAEQSWWQIPSLDGAEAIARLWRHSVAVSLAARRLARDANDPDPGLIAHAALLHRLGLWALAAVDPESLALWLASVDSLQRRELEGQWFGTDLGSFGRSLADQWGCGSLIADATWLYADECGDLSACADDPIRLAFIRQAHAQAQLTPWSLSSTPTREPGRLDPKIRLLMAEVQTRCVGEFVEADATPREERLTRENAALRLETAQLRKDQAGQERLIVALADSTPSERPEIWAERAGLAWCDAHGVAAARVVWVDPTSATEPLSVSLAGDTPRPPSSILPLGPPARTAAEVQLWEVEPQIDASKTVAAWGSWAALVADRARLSRKLDAAVEAFRRRVTVEDSLRGKAKLEALAEFAGGAGHELNNPLAVILGRAQLLLSKVDDPDSLRSLRAIILQAQRAHRILRDLMYVARPPEPRSRLCSADDILRASVRDAQADAEARGIRLVGDPRPSTSLKVWADPDPLRHIADILVRNALEATPSGGTVTVGSSGDERTLRWTVKDSGRGITAQEATHLFDPFYCGRQAGRGLGLGLPRAARIVERAGGDLTWQSAPGQGTSFQLKLPVSPPPTTPAPGGVEPPQLPHKDRAKTA